MSKLVTTEYNDGNMRGCNSPMKQKILRNNTKMVDNSIWKNILMETMKEFHQIKRKTVYLNIQSEAWWRENKIEGKIYNLYLSFFLIIFWACVFFGWMAIAVQCIHQYHSKWFTLCIQKVRFLMIDLKSLSIVKCHHPAQCTHKSIERK